MKPSLRIFVVDDESTISDTLTSILNLKGFSAFAFTNPLEALKSARCDLPDLLVSDVMMPQLTGVELAIRMRGVCPTCKVLLLSGQASFAPLLDDARERGHDFRLLQKPIHPDALIAEITAA